MDEGILLPILWGVKERVFYRKIRVNQSSLVGSKEICASELDRTVILSNESVEKVPTTKNAAFLMDRFSLFDINFCTASKEFKILKMKCTFSVFS